MAERSRQPSPNRTDVLVLFLIGFVAISLPRSLLAGEPQAMASALVVSIVALATSCLVSGFFWRRDAQRSVWVAQSGAMSAAVLALAVGSVTLVGRPAQLTESYGHLGIATCVVISGLAGVTVAAAFFASWVWTGHGAAFALLGAVLGATAPPGWLNENAAPAMAAAVCGLIFAASRRQLVTVLVSSLPLCITVALLVLTKSGWPASTFGVRQGLWLVTDSEVSRWATISSAAVLLFTLAIFATIAAQQTSQNRQWIAALQTVCLLWTVGCAAVLWRAAAPAMGVWAGSHPGTLSIIALGAVTGGFAVDSWPIGSTSVRRSAIAGVAAATIVLWLHPHMELGLQWVPVALGGVTLFLSGLLLATPFIATARTGGELGPAHSVCLFAGGVVVLGAVWQLLSRLHAGPLMTTGLSGLAMASLVAACLAGYGITLPGRVALKQWQWGGWRGRRVYPLPFLALKFFVYLGCAPVWVVIWLVRTTFAALVAAIQVAVEIMSGAVGGFLQLVFGATPSTDARRRAALSSAPIVELRHSLPWQPREGAFRPGETQGRTISFIDVLSAPILGLGLSLDYAIQMLAARKRRKAEERPRPVAIRADTDASLETLVISPAPTAPGISPIAEALRRESLLRRARDSRWRYLLRKLGLGLLGTTAREWLRPDVAEAWDDRLFRAEVVASGGRRFELFGHAWVSPRRVGSVVAIPTIRGQTERVIEVLLGQSGVRELFRASPETLKRVLLRAGFRIAITDLLRGILGSRTIVCHDPVQDLLEPHQDRQCELRQEATGDSYRCRQPLAQDTSRGATNPSACGDCDFPEIWERCANLKLEGTIGIVDQAGRLHRRAHTVCRLSGQVVPLGECPRQECFSPSVITRVIAVDAGRTR